MTKAAEHYGDGPLDPDKFYYGLVTEVTAKSASRVPA